MSTQADNQQDEQSGLGLGDIVAALRRRIWLIVLIVALAGLGAVSFALMLPNQYEAVATIQIDPRKKTIVSLDAVLPDIAGDTPTIESQVEIIRSKVIAEKVIDTLGLRNDPEFGGSPRAAASSPPGAADRRELDARDAARRVLGPEPDAIGVHTPERDVVMAAFLDRLRTVRVRNSLVVEIMFRSRDPVKAARIANTVAEVYIRDQIDMKIKATGLAAELLEPRLDGLRAQVADAERKVARFKSEHGIFDAEGQLLSEKQLARLMEQTVAARNATAEARAKFDQLQTALAEGDGRYIGDVLMSQTVRMLKDQLVKATKRQAELRTKYGPRHPEMAKVRAEVGDIEAQIARETDKILANVRGDLAVAVERERMLDASLAELKQQQSVSKEVTVQLRDFEREAETSRRVLDAFLARYKQTLETQDLHLPDARIVEQADVPFSPVAPKRRQLVLIGLMLGAGLGAGLALLLELLPKGISRAEEAEALIGVPLLASIPPMQLHGHGLTDPLSALRVVREHPQSAYTAAMHGLVRSLDARRMDTGARTILVTASLPNEGTATVAANLALALMARGERVLLIDGDLRLSHLSQHFGLNGIRGLADAVGHGQDFESVILKDVTSGLAVLPAGDMGRFPMAPQDVLSAPGFAQRLARLKAHFNSIVVASPPLLPVVDARILSGYADQMVLVAAWERTPKDVIRKAVRLLDGNAALLSGLVLNHVAIGSGHRLPVGRRASAGHRRQAGSVGRAA